MPCFAQNPTQALSSSDLQLLLGLPLSGSSGGYAHQTTLRLFSSSAPPKRTSQSGAGRLAQLREPRFQDMKILGVPAIGLGGVAWGWGSLVTGRKVAEEEEAVQSSAPAQCQCTREDRSPEVPAGGKLCLHHTTTTGRLGCSNQPDSRLKLPPKMVSIGLVSGIKTNTKEHESTPASKKAKRNLESLPLPLSRPFLEGRGCLAEIPPPACRLPSCDIESPCGTNLAPLLGCSGWFSGHDQNFAFVPLIDKRETHRKMNNYFYIDSDKIRCYYLLIFCVSQFCTFNLLLYEKEVKRLF